MTSVHLTVHRATHEIGGNCIEINAADGHRIILDVGRPLDAPFITLITNPFTDIIAYYSIIDMSEFNFR